MRIFRRFNNLPIEKKLLLVSVIPILTLAVLSIVTFNSVQTFSRDEDRLNQVYHVQTTAADYLRLIVDLETGFRGFVLTLQPKFLNPYHAAKQRVLQVGRTLAQMVEHDKEQHAEILNAQDLVQTLMEDKDRLIEQAKLGYSDQALQYIESGAGRRLMLSIREQIARFGKQEGEVLRQTLERTSNDRGFLLSVIVGGGSLALIPMVFVLRLLAQSIAGPLVSLAKSVENRPGGTVPDVQVLDRGDEIGDLTRVMHEMGQQIREFIGQIQQSESALRNLNIDLSNSESKYRGIVDHAPFGIFTARDGRIIFCNRDNWRLAGHDPDNPLDPERIWNAVHPGDRTQVYEAFSKATAQQIPFENVFRFVHPDGTTHKVLSRAVPIHDGQGGGSLYQGFNVDITAFEQMKETLSRTERLATLGQVAAGIAHEIRNPLVGIGSTTSLLMEDFPSEDTKRQDLHTILKETRRLDRIVTQIVEYARPRDIVPGSFEMPALVTETLDLLSHAVAQKHINVTATFPPELPALEADRDQVKQVVLNAIQNSVEALEENGEIRVEAQEELRDGYKGLLTTIHDNGKGISPEDLPRIFDPFFTMGKRRGTGLGLAICRNIIEAHGGSIRADSQVGVGTVMAIWLPFTLQQQPITVA